MIPDKHLLDDATKHHPLHRQGRLRSNGMVLFYETFGEPANPAVLLIIGMDTQCTLWFPHFYEPIVAAGYYVIRFDNRDCGLSEWIDNWDPDNPYTLEDMAADTLGLLEALNIEKAHLIGASMGGMIAQRVAIKNPDQTRTLTLIASSGFALDPDPALQPAGDPERSLSDHEGLVARYPNYMTVAADTIEYRLEVLRSFAGSRFPFEESLHRETQTRNIVARKGFNPLAQIHQTAAVIASGSRLDELGRITAPTLILHGTEDPLLSSGHALKCARRIPGAKLVWMEGVGHELPAGIMNLAHREILDLLSR